MQARLHLDTLLHLLREHPDMVEQALNVWPRDDEGHLKTYKGVEPTPGEAQKAVVMIVAGADADEVRDKPYFGATSVTNRSSPLTDPDQTPDKGTPKRIPPAFLKPNPRLKQMETPLNIEGGPPPKVARSGKGPFDAKQIKGKAVTDQGPTDEEREDNSAADLLE